uniref:Uncharacterized protein n=1 Tax=Chromera velia CCMP2878 TaxID=1169474 RepID=A0A0G4F214_9ALVE|eukprot:Cvel_14782.t1-p1 / transcript=Cvel_14782.t1 / gene=Cvel_14782 / organism=Chromera_velia_CCMP2878 / gene_product=hypothetical protein / transcript_product=hypothetical protein / location=Cvel_scaffold1064:53187-53735(-) / protein_length=73 / sequence_SO=supercontig / SO=protein_coding / is_pseudo=false
MIAKKGSYAELVDVFWVFRDHLLIVTKKYEGDLVDLKEKVGTIDEDLAVDLLQQLLVGLEKLHNDPDEIAQGT